MTTHIKRLCDSLDLPRADAWAAHGAIERWLRAESEPDSEASIDRLTVGSRLLAGLETGDRLTSDQLSLLAERCRERLDDDTAPARDRESLAAVIDRVDHALEACSA